MLEAAIMLLLLFLFFINTYVSYIKYPSSNQGYDTQNDVS